MRLSNRVDKGYVVSLLPESLGRLVDVLPALPRGQLVALGLASNMPVRVAVSTIGDACCTPRSGDPEFGAHWGKPIDQRAQPDIEKICDLWIRSQKPDA
jgi:DNA helicase HerA-like ATPase